MSLVHNLPFEYSPCTAPKSSRVLFQVMPTNLPIAAVSLEWIIEPCFLPATYEPLSEDILNFEVRPDDIWILSFPKSGSSVIQEIVWLLNNNLDYHTAQTNQLRNRHVYMEAEMIVNVDVPFDKNIIQRARYMRSPRFFKCHLPVGLLPAQLWTVKPKIIYIACDPKEVAVEYYYYLKILPRGYTGTFPEFCEGFMLGRVVFGPYHSHVLNFWSMRHEDNILFIHYEQLKSDLMSLLKMVAAFLQRSYSDEQLRSLASYVRKDVTTTNELGNPAEIAALALLLFKDKSHVNKFQFRRYGQSSTFDLEMSPQLIDKFDRWTAKGFENTDFKIW